MMKRKTIMLFCSLMYRIAEVKNIVFLWMQLTCLGNYFEIILSHMLILTIMPVKTDQITANISGHAVTSSVCRRQCAGFTYPSD